MIKKVEHIGIAVKDLKKSENLFEKLLGAKPYKKEEVKSEGVVTSFFKIADQKIELLHASSKNSAKSSKPNCSFNKEYASAWIVSEEPKVVPIIITSGFLNHLVTNVDQ